MTTTLDNKRESLASLRINRNATRPPSLLGRMVKLVMALVCLGGLGWGGFVIAKQQGWVTQVSDLVPESIRNLPEVRVERVTVERGRSADANVVATGYLESRRQAMIGARAAGRIETVNVEEGTRVSSGEVMAVLEHKDMDAALAAIRATLARSVAELAEQNVEIARTKTELDRSQRLRDQGSNTVGEYDKARFAHDAAVARKDSLEAAVELAKARVVEAEQMLENMIIRAPFDGTVISKDAEVGESILPGGMGEASGRGSVVTIADLQHLEVDTDVKEDYISRISEGSPVEVAVDAVPDRRYSGVVRKIIPMGDRARATIKVKVSITDVDERLFPDMSATVYFLTGQQETTVADERPRVFCRSDSIRRDDAGTFVWQVDAERRAQRVNVTAGDERDGRMEILEGLEGGEAIITGEAGPVTTGSTVKVKDSL